MSALIGQFTAGIKGLGGTRARRGQASRSVYAGSESAPPSPREPGMLMKMITALAIMQVMAMATMAAMLLLVIVLTMAPRRKRPPEPRG